MMAFSISFQPEKLKWTQPSSYWLTFAFVAGNLLLPQLCHLLPSGGRIFLPIYFFTLIAAYRFGITVGLLTAVFSPLVNYWIFQMPPAHALPIILMKSLLLAITASVVALRARRLSIVHLFAVVIIYQLIGSLLEWAITGSLQAALQDITQGVPGILLQILGGYIVLRILKKNDA